MTGRRRRTSALRYAVPAATVLAVLLVVVGVRLLGRGDRTTSTPVADAPTHREVATGTTIRGRPTCGQVSHPFAPRTVSVPGATRAAPVVTPPRDANGIPGTPPLTSAGKEMVAWDTAQGTRPGDRHGNVLLNAHTWPDGSALGNRLLATLHRGSRVVLHGPGDLRLCYRVTEEVQVLASKGLRRYYDLHGPPQIAILVCSGRRLGPGVWTHRTVWFASPAA
jgi:hypothetical protein